LNTIPTYDLNAMRSVDIRTVDPATLADIRDVKANLDLPFLERTFDLLRQTPNAYCYRCGDIAFKIRHSQTAISINDCMEGFYRSF
jgi:hypothetical protein